MNREVIYLDNNATTPVDPKVLEAMLPFLKDNFANASSTHQFGVIANDAVKKARTQVANLIGAQSNEVIFTSGATEAINLAIKGVAESYSSKGNHIITVCTEHTATVDTLRHLESRGLEVTYLPVNENGLIDLNDLKNALRPTTILVAVMFSNNETGVIQPIAEISSLAHKIGALFFCDATQAVGKIDVTVDTYGIDLLAMSGHKLYAPKGVGALYIRQRSPNKVKIPALIHGGGHERGYRSGTLNVPGIVALGKACELAQQSMKKESIVIAQLRDYLQTELLKIDGAKVNGDFNNRIYNVVNICFKGVDSDAMIIGLSDSDENIPLIAVSNGSACTSTSMTPSHVLIGMGLSEIDAYSSIRFSLGRFNRKEELETVIERVKSVVSGLVALTN